VTRILVVVFKYSESFAVIVKLFKTVMSTRQYGERQILLRYFFVQNRNENIFDTLE